MQTSRDNFLFYFAVGLAIFCISAFGVAALENPARQERYSILVIVHAASMAAWLFLFAYQANLVRQNQTGLHMRVGKVSAAIVAAIVVTGVMVAFNFHDDFGRSVTLFADLSILVNFVPLYVLALYFVRRGDRETHKRLLLVGSIVLTAPAYARLTDILDLPRSAAALMYLSILIVVPIVFDLKFRRRPHIASVASILYSLLTVVAVFVYAANTGGL